MKSSGKHNHELEPGKLSFATQDSVPNEEAISLAGKLLAAPSNLDLTAELLKNSNVKSLAELISQALKQSHESESFLDVTNSSQFVDDSRLDSEPESMAASSHPDQLSQSRVILKRKKKSIGGDSVKHSKLEASIVGTQLPMDVLDFSQPISGLFPTEDFIEQEELGSPDCDSDPDYQPASTSSTPVQKSKSNKRSIKNADGDRDDRDGIPEPLPEMPDTIRDEFVLINAPDGRNHILQDGHIFSKDKCSSKSVSIVFDWFQNRKC